MSIIQKIKKENHGFIEDKDVPEIIKEDCFVKVLVRCGAGRFTCPAQDLEHFIGIIEREKTDYVRDVSFLATK